MIAPDGWHERATCRLCDAQLPEERVLDLGSTPLANALLNINPVPAYDEFTYPLFLKQCSVCGHCQLPVVVDPKLLFPADYPYASSTGEAMRKHLDDFARDVPRPNDQSVLEIGSNDGYLLRQFDKHGMRPVGVDPAFGLAREALKHHVVTLPYFFDETTAAAINHSLGMFDLVVALNVFAHSDNLHGIAEGLGLLEHDGMFVFEVGYLPDVVRTNNFGTVYGEHLSYHTLAPLVGFFERHGLVLFDAHRVDTQGGSVRCFVGWKDMFYKRERLSELIAAESSLDLSGWQARVNEAAGMLRTRLQALRLCGKRIAAYGCSAKSTTLLHVAGIGRETIDFICDDAPTKQGKFSPGKHIPIVPGSWLEEKQPDYCVSLSGNFSEAFKAAHPGYRGEWVEPNLTGET